MNTALRLVHPHPLALTVTDWRDLPGMAPPPRVETTTFLRRAERSAYVDALLRTLHASGARLVWGRSSDRPGGAVHVHAPNGAPSPAAPGA